MVKDKFQTLIILCHYTLGHKVNLKKLLHLHDTDINMAYKLHSLTNRGLEHRGLHISIKSLASTIKSLITTLLQGMVMTYF